MQVPSSSHFIYIPIILVLGLVLGFILGAKATRDAVALEERRQADRAARRAARAAAATAAEVESSRGAVTDRVNHASPTLDEKPDKSDQDPVRGSTPGIRGG